ncbi:unnamed protein product [Rhodiola kirilowii]
MNFVYYIFRVDRLRSLDFSHLKIGFLSEDSPAFRGCVSVLCTGLKTIIAR